jgi:GrpB-like predicted nucleotidyltransferase (UPF0157 family)
MDSTVIYGMIIAWLLSLGFVWVKGVRKRKALVKEIKELKQYTNTHMNINAKGLEEQERMMRALRKRNENLQLTLATLKAKTTTEEKMLLRVYDRAVHLMYERAPGFSNMWEIIMREARGELMQADDGCTSIAGKIVRPSFFKGKRLG